MHYVSFQLVSVHYMNVHTHMFREHGEGCGIVLNIDAEMQFAMVTLICVLVHKSTALLNMLKS